MTFSNVRGYSYFYAAMEREVCVFQDPKNYKTTIRNDYFIIRNFREFSELIFAVDPN